MKSGTKMRYGVCILAGGLSRRMGKDKARLRIGRQMMISRAAKAAVEAEFKVRIIRRDMVARCGPLGGIYTGLKGSRGDAEIFMACDMPFVTPKLLRQLAFLFAKHKKAVFLHTDGVAGFPCLLPVSALETVAAQIQLGEFSLQALATRLRGRRLHLGAARAAKELINVNTAPELEAARRLVTVACH